jgi:formylmethanofuran dehydrogenase subunit E
MMRMATLAGLLSVVTHCYGESPQQDLPTPHYHRDASDPAWLIYAAQFHGHLGPWATAGLRAGIVARHAASAAGYFDVEVTVEGPFTAPPRACFLDGIQVATGATLGKRNLQWVKADEIVVRLRNTRSGAVADVRPTAQLLKLLGSLTLRSRLAPPHDSQATVDHDARDRDLEILARRIAHIADKELFRVQRQPAQVP